MPDLPEAQAGNELSDAEALRAIEKLCVGKACGADNIPSEVYKNVPICKSILIKLLQRIWREEDVPEEFAKTGFVMI